MTGQADLKRIQAELQEAQAEIGTAATVDHSLGDSLKFGFGSLLSAIGALFLTGTLQAGLVSTVNGTGDFFDLAQTFGCSNTGTTTASCSFMRGDAFLSANGSYQADAQYGSLDVTSMSTTHGAGFLSGS